MGEAIRMSHGINTVTDKGSDKESPEGVLDDLSDLSDVEESDYEGEFDGQSPYNDVSELLNNSGNIHLFEYVTNPYTSTPLSTRSHSLASNISGQAALGLDPVPKPADYGASKHTDECHRGGQARSKRDTISCRPTHESAKE